MGDEETDMVEFTLTYFHQPGTPLEILKRVREQLRLGFGERDTEWDFDLDIEVHTGECREHYCGGERVGNDIVGELHKVLTERRWKYDSDHPELP